MDLVIAEKPSVAATIASVLGAKERHDGYFKGNGYYITFVFGHLLTLWDAKDYDPKFASWNMDNLPVIPNQFRYKLQDDAGVKKQFKVIKGLIEAPEVTCIINACDSDREGSLIGAEVITETKTTKTVKRLWVSSHTPEDIKAGFANIKTAAEDAPLTSAGYARQWADWLFGINFTVATTKMFAKDNSVLKVGRVILPTIHLVYLREMEIKKFVPRKYFELRATFGGASGTYEGLYFDDQRNQFNDRADLDKVLNFVKGKPGVVTSVQTKRITQGAPKLFNLTDLQGQITNKYAGFTAEKVLRLAQSLYEKQLTTYPRTASRYLDNSQIETAERSLAAVQHLVPECELTFKETKTVFDSSKVDSHPALMPTYLVLENGVLSLEEQIVYLEIVKRFAAQFAPVAEYEQTEAVTEINGFCFKTKGKTLVVSGWKKLYQSFPEDEEDKEPELKVKLFEKMPVHTLEAKTLAKATKPPARYTVQTLLEAMQNCGKSVADETTLIKGYQIGTSATRAEILKKIEETGYVVLKKKTYEITKMGISLVELFPLKELLEPDFTGRIERQLKQIEQKEVTQDIFMKSVRDMVAAGIERMRGMEGSISRVVPEKDNLGPCPCCSKMVVEKEKIYGCTEFKEGCDFGLFKENALLKSWGINKVPVKLVKDLLANSLQTVLIVNGKKIPVMVKKGAKFWEYHFDLESMEVISLGACPECGQKIIENPKNFGCSGWKAGCKYGIWKEDHLLKSYGVMKVTPKMAKDVLSKGFTVIKGMMDPKTKVKFDGEIRRVKKNNAWGWQIKRVKD
jgi:DNA topoisomerase-3